jgi:hypothetical protein
MVLVFSAGYTGIIVEDVRCRDLEGTVCRSDAHCALYNHLKQQWSTLYQPAINQSIALMCQHRRSMPLTVSWSEQGGSGASDGSGAVEHPG